MKTSPLHSPRATVAQRVPHDGPGSRLPKEQTLARMAHLEGSSIPSMLIVLATLCLVMASISRLPYIESLSVSFVDQRNFVRLGVSLAEGLSTLVLFCAVLHQRQAIASFLVGCLVIAVRFFVAAWVANSGFAQSFEASFQEARFGVCIATVPLVVAFLHNASDRQLRYLVGLYLALLLILDVYILTMVSRTEDVVLGTRSPNRLVCSIVAPLATVLALVGRKIRLGGRDFRFEGFSGIVMLAHTVLVTTSRVETCLSIATLAFITCCRWPVLRVLFTVTWVLAVPLLAREVFSPDGLGGRDFVIAVEATLRTPALGHGLVTDSTARGVLGLPESFFFSDYGILAYVLRYGVLGYFMAFGLLIFWGSTCARMSKQPGIVMIGFALLVYLLFIPILDYSSCHGAFLLAYMWHASQNSRTAHAPN